MSIHNKLHIGDRRGKRVILGFDPSGTAKYPRYWVRCDCGAESVISGGSLGSACKRCGVGGRKNKYGDKSVAGLKLYQSWVAMRRRCDPEVEPIRNARWAGRGIKVCAEWQDFVVFRQWAMDNGYREGLSLDRLDNDGDYEPSNCEWVTRSVNSKRCRALHKMVLRSSLPMLYDEPWFGDA